MAPEETEGPDVDHRADIWSLGVVIYEMMTGRLPFEGNREQAVIHSIVHEDYEPITGLRVRVPVELDRIVSKALAKDPDERYRHIDELLMDLRALKKSLSGGSRPVSPGSGVVRAMVGPYRFQRGLESKGPTMLFEGEDVGSGHPVQLAVLPEEQARAADRRRRVLGLAMVVSLAVLAVCAALLLLRPASRELLEPVLGDVDRRLPLYVNSGTISSTITKRPSTCGGIACLCPHCSDATGSSR